MEFPAVMCTTGQTGSIPDTAYRQEVRSRAICTYGVVVTYDLAKVGSRVRIPLGALIWLCSVAVIASACHAEDHGFNSRQSRFRHQQQLFFLIEDHSVTSSSLVLRVAHVAQLVEHVYSSVQFLRHSNMPLICV